MDLRLGRIRYRWLLVASISIVALISASVSWVACGYTQKSAAVALKPWILQRLYSGDRSTCWQVIVFFKAKSTHTIDIESHQIWDVELAVIEESAQSRRFVFRRQFNRTYTFRGFNSIPTWTGRYLVNEEQVLPSARLYQGHYNIPRLVVFDGDKCRLYQLDERAEFKDERALTRADREDLRKVFSSSFSVDDVYWSYGLLRCGEWFSRPAVRFPTGAGIEQLFQAWQNSREY